MTYGGPKGIKRTPFFGGATNRLNRRAAKKMAKENRFVAKCQACAGEACEVHVLVRHGEKELGICKGCPCAAGMCEACGETGQHWLACSVVGLPAIPSKASKGETIQ